MMYIDYQPTANNWTNASGYANVSDCANMTLAECRMGPIRDPLSTVIPMTLVYAVILMTGVTGNVCTCIVIARNRYMHTATNYYLFSLAVSDLMLLVLGLPQELYQLWYRYPYVFGEPFCILRGLTSEMSTNASILTITAFTVERYVAICHPFRAQAMSHLPRAVRTILAIWTCAALCALPMALQFGIQYEWDDAGAPMRDSALCSVIRPLPHAFELSTCLFFVLPIVLISVLYVLIGIRLRQGSIGKKRDGINTDSNFLSKQKVNSRKAVIKMLAAVVICFCICWSPFHAQRLLAIYANTDTTPAHALILTFSILTYISGVTYYLSATLNPILYQLLSGKFRQAFKDTFCGRRKMAAPKMAPSPELGHLDNNSRYRVGFQSVAGPASRESPLPATVSWTTEKGFNSNHSID